MKYRDHFERELFCRRMLSAKVPAVSSDEVNAAVAVPDLNLNLIVKDDGDGIATIPTAVKKISSEEEVGDSRFVLPILRTHNSEEDCEFKYEVDIKGFGEYPYCLVMDAADRSLADVMTHEDVAGKDWKQIRLIMEQIIENLDQMHSRGFIHGDMKPQNIVRDSARMKLIDLESSVCYTDGQFAGVKVSSAYAPPEMVQLASPSLPISISPSAVTVPGIGTVGLGLEIAEVVPPLGRKAFVRALHRPFTLQRTQRMYGIQTSQEGAQMLDTTDMTTQYSLLPASPSYDMWSVGVIFFELCTGEPLFLADEGDNIDEDALVSLNLWSNEFKRKKLAKVSDPYARHLLSQLLQKDPTRRPMTKRVLAHPFLTGKKAQRLVGEKAEYDVFISYRVFADVDHAERLYHLLTAKGLKVWWDRVALQPGVPWEEGFCEGLMKCKSFVPLLSRAAVKGFQDLNEHSRCDNVLLEFRMAQELRAAGFIEKIFPVMIGDRETFEVDNEVFHVYNDYLQSGCHPSSVPSCPVISVENKLRSHFDNTALGAPFLTERSVSGILSDIMANQGGFIKGKLPANSLASLMTDTDREEGIEALDDEILSEMGSDETKENEKDKEKDKLDVDAFSSVVDSIVRMLGKDRVSVRDSLKMDGSEGENFMVFDILSPGIFRPDGGMGSDFGRVPLKEKISAVEKEIAYLTSMLADLYNEQSDEDNI
jgi:serine/threonine protein kinase